MANLFVVTLGETLCTVAGQGVPGEIFESVEVSLEDVLEMAFYWGHRGRKCTAIVHVSGDSAFGVGRVVLRGWS